MHYMQSFYRVAAGLVPLLDLYGTRPLVQPIIVNGTWQKDPVTGALLNQTLPTVSVDFEYLGHVTWGNSVLNAYSNLETNCWGALTTVAPWLATKYGMVGCNITVSKGQGWGGWVGGVKVLVRPVPADDVHAPPVVGCGSQLAYAVLPGSRIIHQGGH
jgi:hypothetical protein